MPLLSAYITPHPPIAIPEIGKEHLHEILATIDSFQQISKSIAIQKPDTLIFITPHAEVYYDYFHIASGSVAEGSFSAFRCPQVSLHAKYDETLREKIIELAARQNFPAGTLGEKSKLMDHGTLVPLYYLYKDNPDIQILRISISGMTPAMHYEFGKLIKAAIESVKRKVIIIASGDLSHKLKEDGPYGFDPAGPKFDQMILDIIQNKDFSRFMEIDEAFCEEAAECGLRSFIVMSGILDGLDVKSQLYSYEGPFGVGYAIAEFLPIEQNENRHFGELIEKKHQEELFQIRMHEDAFVKLARNSLEHFIITGSRISMPDNLPDDLTKYQAAVFVSIKKDGRLRGCIGSIEPTRKAIADEIIYFAEEAGTKDPRFDPITKEELDHLIYSVDVLKKAESIPDISYLNPQKYGVIVKCRGRRGLLLPNLEGIDTSEKQVEIALKKAGIQKHELYSLERFEVIRHH